MGGRITYLRTLATSSPKGFSQQYILITRIPDIISFIIFTRSSVCVAVLRLMKQVQDLIIFDSN